MNDPDRLFCIEDSDILAFAVPDGIGVRQVSPWRPSLCREFSLQGNDKLKKHPALPRVRLRSLELCMCLLLVRSWLAGPFHDLSVFALLVLPRSLPRR